MTSLALVVRTPRRERAVTATVHDPAATVGDLLAALGLQAPGVRTDGRFLAAGLALREAGLLAGSVLEPADGPTPRPGPDRATCRLTVTTGPAAGAWVALTEGACCRAGRADHLELALADPTVSELHATLTVTDRGGVRVEDAGSTNGTWVAGRPVHGAVELPVGAGLRLGATRLGLRGRAPDDRPSTATAAPADGRIDFNRPPRGPAPGPPEPVTVPPRPGEPDRQPALNAAMLLGPLVFAGALVALYGSPRFALFALLSPVMVLGNWLAARQRARRERRAGARRLERDLQRLSADLAAAAAAERARRAAVLTEPAEILRRATAPSTRLWERRPDRDDFLRLRAGTGTVAFHPPVEEPDGPVPDRARRLLEQWAGLPRAPVAVELAGGGVVGIVGRRPAALALTRSLVCQAGVLHGPADVSLVVVADADRAGDWTWTRWLPHAGGPADPAVQPHAGPDGGPTRLLVIDGIDAATARDGPGAQARELLAGGASAVVLAASADRLPASTTAVVELDDSGAVLRRPPSGEVVDDLLTAGLAADRARRCARALARFRDPERARSAGLPATVRLPALLGLRQPTGEAIRAAWAGGGPDPAPAAPVGVGPDGPVRLDLVADGPHGLIGGTTGSGKSELLRALVAGIAARVGPQQCTFVLIDYKGGSTFDRCARLPHTVGLVTDLDEHLGRRALRSLEAELARRERRLRVAGAEDLTAYRAAGAPQGPLPRLVVVVDEFAALARELPAFLSALVDVAQRGRSLGMHLLLATQRPSGVVDASIEANTNLRIALRVQDRADSMDVIGSPDAAHLAREHPGRACVRRGPGELVTMQAALVTAPALEHPDAPVTVAPLAGGAGGAGGAPAVSAGGAPVASATGAGDAATDLDRLVAAVRAAHEATGRPEPRRPWLPPLPERLAFAELAAAAPAGPPEDQDEDQDQDEVVFALADEPDAQRRSPVGWSPARGHLGLFGAVGSGTTTALLTLGRSLAERRAAADCHLYALDFGAGELEALAPLPHVGAVITPTEQEAQHRLLRRLRGELERRRGLGPAELAARPRLVVLIDNVAGFLAEHEDLAGAPVADAFRRLFAEGPAVRISFAVTGDRLGALPLRLSGLVAQKVVFRLADPAAFAAVGLRPDELPSFVPGRAVLAEDGRVIQTALPGDLAAVGRRLADRHTDGATSGDELPRPVPTLPTRIATGDLPAARLQTRPARLPVGLADDDLQPAWLDLHRAGHALVAGPPGSGKTTALACLATVVRRAAADAVLVGVAPPGPEPSRLTGLGALDAAGPVDELATVLRRAIDDDRLWVVLVDDAPRLADPAGLLAAAAGCGRPGLHVVAAGRTEALRGTYGHWTRAVAGSRTGLLLRPDLAADGELLATRLPRRVACPLVAGRGFVVNAGQPTLAQLAMPDGG